ncbi:hypothetical protein [Actinomadura terrae]|uniref:hypothetical protein n=1 Tax=Actinomadura terrae TaxID=604353 RepID=UPI001FA6DE34|nr:hypothetical protein [Actinomadura terrae]
MATSEPEKNCPSGGGKTITHTYDSADRIVDFGYVYDKLRRTIAVPDGTRIDYQVNDLVH